jgi:hypothetical protein
VDDAAGPSARWGDTAVYDGKRDRMLVFAGEGASGELADVWSFDLGSGDVERTHRQCRDDAARAMT